MYNSFILALPEGSTLRHNKAALALYMLGGLSGFENSVSACRYHRSPENMIIGLVSTGLTLSYVRLVLLPSTNPDTQSIHVCSLGREASSSSGLLLLNPV